MGVIYKKELKGYFTGMMGYVFIAFALAVIGIYTVAVNFIQSYPNFEYVLDSVRFLFLLLIPILTMRTMSDEKRQRTDLLLYSSPISTYSIILGKFFAALTVFAVPFAVSCFYPLIIGRYGVVNYKVAYSAIFGFLLMGGACIAIGIFLTTYANFNPADAQGITEWLFSVRVNYAIQRTCTVIIGMIPSGMLLLTSVALAVGVIRLTKHNTLVQD